MYNPKAAAKRLGQPGHSFQSAVLTRGLAWDRGQRVRQCVRAFVLYVCACVCMRALTRVRVRVYVRAGGRLRLLSLPSPTVLWESAAIPPGGGR